MFQKLVAIEPVSLIPEAEKKLYGYAHEVTIYNDVPATDEEIINRIGDADAVLLSYTSRINRFVLERCPNIRYIGMCCSLYSPESANVDIRYAEEHGITVTGIRDYGDEGVVEYVLSELVRCLHGFGEEAWDGMAREITGLKVGIVGLGKSGGMIADAMKFFGADITYFARSEKKEATRKGYRFLPLKELLSESEVVFCCLNKNTILLHKAEFDALGNKKYYSIQDYHRHGTKRLSQNGWKVTIYVSATHWELWATKNSFIIRTYAACRYRRAAPVKRLTA